MLTIYLGILMNLSYYDLYINITPFDPYFDDGFMRNVPALHQKIEPFDIRFIYPFLRPFYVWIFQKILYIMFQCLSAHLLNEKFHFVNRTENNTVRNHPLSDM